MNGDDSLALRSYGLNTNWTNDPNQVQVCKFRLTRLIKCRCASPGLADRKQVKLISTGKKQGEGPTQGNTNMETKTLDTHTHRKKYHLLPFNFSWQRSNLHQSIVLLGVEVASSSEGHRHTHANRQSRVDSKFRHNWTGGTRTPGKTPHRNSPGPGKEPETIFFAVMQSC